MPNPYLADALRKQQEKRKRLAAESSADKGSAEKKAAQKSADNDSTPSKEN